MLSITGSDTFRHFLSFIFFEVRSGIVINTKRDNVGEGGREFRMPTRPPVLLCDVGGHMCGGLPKSLLWAVRRVGDRQGFRKLSCYLPNTGKLPIAPEQHVPLV